MKPEIHPKLNPVVFVDGDHQILTRSTMKSTEKRSIDGVDHFVVHVDISAYSHPFYTGKQKLVDRAGRIERFKQRYEKK
ncbi:MAG TPA: type B 50S ribosomal protein L31 [Polyangiaceae bacterium]|nr:type B 50S ribosomal protein L31 [Polyangiaceae bacterium]